MGLDSKNPAFGVSDLERLKPTYSATDTGLNIEIFHGKRLTSVLSDPRNLISSFVFRMQ